jgi:surfeit locus 1 family protein
MTLRKWILTIVAVTAAAVFIALGLWQLRRLDARRDQNSFLASRRFAPETELEGLPADTAAARFRRVRLRGVYDFSNEIIHTLRGREGSPGVNILTPLRRAGNDTAVLVNRGWVYAPDGITVDTERWREPDTLVGSGFVETFPTTGPFAAPSRERPRSFRRLHRDALTEVFPYPIANYYVILTDSAVTSPQPGSVRSLGRPPRVQPPSLDEGPHRNYAVQWFSFAAISIIGLVIFIRRA